MNLRDNLHEMSNKIYGYDTDQEDITDQVAWTSRLGTCKVISYECFFGLCVCVCGGGGGGGVPK